MQITALLSTALLLTGVLAQDGSNTGSADTDATDTVTPSHNDQLSNCYDNSCSNFRQSDLDCHDSANGNITEYYSCVYPEMVHTLNSNDECVDCLSNGGFNLSAQAQVYGKAFANFSPSQASSFSENYTPSSSSTASPSPTSPNNNNDGDGDNTDDDDSSATHTGVATAAAALLLTAVGCLI
ncbi:hypothetical protein E3P77_03583 [Wallemia ichthyophaga]|nr:hypothetical protein E3P77_03583 [Wallemia ichthyophaga]